MVDKIILYSSVNEVINNKESKHFIVKEKEFLDRILNGLLSLGVIVEVK